MTENHHTTDVCIIGAGPVGLFAVFECGMLKLKCHVVDSLDAVGGQCTALYPEKPIYDIPGFPKVDAADLITNLEAQASPFEPTYHLGQQVTGLTRVDDRFWRLTTSAGTVIDATAVIIAAGVGAFGPNRPPLEGLDGYEASGAVQYYVRQREAFRGHRVVIAGGGDSAVDWAVSLADVADHVYVVHRRAKFRAAPEMVSRLHALAEQGTISLVVPYQLGSLKGDGETLTGVAVRDMDGNEQVLDADRLLPFFGLSMDLGPIATWDLELERKQIVVDPTTCQTSMAGVFGIGDVVTYPGKLKLILTGFSEAAMAAHAIHPIARPDEVLHFEYSTTKGVPGT